MLVSDADPVFAGDFAALGGIEEESHNGFVVEGAFVLVHGFDFDVASATVADGVVVIVAMRFLDDNFVFQAGHVRGDADNGGLVGEGNASGGTEGERGGSTGGDESGFTFEALREVIAGSIAKFEDVDGLEGGQSDGSLDFIGHGGTGENGVGASSVDEGSDAELFVIVHTFEGRARGRQFIGTQSRCSTGTDGSCEHGAATFAQEFATRYFFGHGSLLRWRNCLIDVASTYEKQENPRAGLKAGRYEPKRKACALKGDRASVAREIVRSRGRISTECGRSEILFSCFFPLDHAEARGIVENAASADGHAGNDANIAIHAREATINVAEFAVKFLEDGDIGVFTDGESAEVGTMDFAGGIDGGALDEIVEGHAHGTEFGNDFVKTEDGEVTGVLIGGHGIRDKALLDRGNGIAKPKASGAVADIKNHAALAGFKHDGVELAIGKDDRELLRKDVGVNITWAGLFKDEVGVGTVRARPEIEHDGAIGGLGAGNGVIHRGPGSVLTVPGSVGPVVSSLHTDDDGRIFFDGVDAALDVHLVDALLETAAHAVGDNVEEGENAYFGVIDDAFLFLEKRFGAGSASIDDGGYARLKSEIGRNAKGIFMRASFRIEPVERSAAKSGVVMDIDEAGGDVETGRVHDLSGRIGGNVFFDGSDFAAGDSDVHYGVNVVGRIDDVAALEKEIVAGGLGVGRWEQGEEREDSSDAEN